MADIHYDFLKSLSDVLKGLAGTPVKNVRSVVEAPLVDAISSGRDAVDISGVTYPTSMLGELQVEGGFHGNLRVTPAGARFLIDLYERDLLPRKSGVSEKSVDPAIRAYAESEADLILKTQEIATKARMRNEKHKRLVQNPAEVTEDLFEYFLLNDIFFEHNGAGAGAMTIGGIEVSKSVSNFSSNSGKNSDWGVRFTWRSADGELKSVHKPSIYAGNRRNDADRNWGLGPE